MNETTKKERNDISATLTAAAAVTVVVLVGSVVRWVETFTDVGVTVPVPFPGVPVEMSPGEGIPAATVQVMSGLLVAQDVNPISVASLAASILVAAVSWIAVAACVALLARRFLRGQFFDRTNVRLLDSSAWTMLGGALAVLMFETFGRNGVLAAAGVGDYTPDPWVVLTPFVPVWIAATVLGLVSLAFRRGIRLQRDTEGLV